MHASIHASIHTWIHTYIHYISLHCIALHYITLHCITYRHTYIHTYMIIHVYSRVYIYIYIIVLLYLHIYIYIHMCVFSCSLSAPPGLFAKKQRISYSPQKGWNVTHFAMFDWRRVPHSTDSSSCSPMKKKHLQLAESVEFSWKPPYPFRSFPYFSIVGSGGGTPSFSALRSSWNLGHPRPLGGRGVLDPGNVVKGRSFLLRKNTPCSTEWIYYIYIYIHIISYI